MAIEYVKFPRDKMMSILWEEDDNAEIISDMIVDNTRWAIQHEFIFKYDGKLYKTWYRVGATEYQDESPWENDEEVNCVEVVPVEKTIIAYEPVNG